MIVTVRRSFQHKGKLLPPGKVVDATGWRNLNKMLAQRYVIPGGDLPRREKGEDKK